MSNIYYQVDLVKFTVTETSSPDKEAYYSNRKQTAYRHLFNHLPKEILLSDKGREIEAIAFPYPLYCGNSQSEWMPTYLPGDFIRLQVAKLEEKENTETYYYAIDFNNNIVYHSLVPFKELRNELFYTTSKECFYLKTAYSNSEDDRFRNLCKIKGLSNAAKMNHLSEEGKDISSPKDFVLL